MAEEIKVSRSTLGLLLGALVVSLMGVAFLLGRQSAPDLRTPGPVPANGSGDSSSEGRPTPRPLVVDRAAPVQRQPEAIQPVAPPPVPVTVSVVPTQPVVERPRLPQSTVPTALPRAVSVKAAQTVPTAHPQVPSPTASAPPAPADPKIAGYFANIDEALRDTASMGDSNQLATEILQQGMNGDTKGFDDLLESTRKAQSALARIHPPPACREHYKLLRRQLEQSIDLLGRVKKATVSLDSGALTSLASEGRALQAEADRFKALDTRLRTEAGR